MITGRSDTASLQSVDLPLYYTIHLHPATSAIKQAVMFTDIRHWQLHLSWAEICPLYTLYKEQQDATRSMAQA